MTSGDIEMKRGVNLYDLISRLVDIIVSLIILVIFPWFLLVVWVAVKVQSPGPGIFAQARVGQHGKIFKCFKFRTMSQGAPQVGTHEANPSSITALGRLLRRTKLDELPQAFNVLLNQMSLVGPRPCLPSQLDVIAEREKRGVFAIKPGITGLAQVMNIDMSEPERLATWDARYMRSRSISLYFSILIQTALGRGGGDPIHRRNK